MTGQVSRTVYNYLDLVTHIPHFVDYFLNFAVYDFYSVLDAVCDPQDFRIRHPSPRILMGSSRSAIPASFLRNFSAHYFSEDT